MFKFADNLKDCMKQANITVESLAFESGYSEKYITELRNGRKANPSIMCVELLAFVLNVSPSLLTGWKEE
jgi:transcriptional regulator with XRE-family HTH domain